MLAPATVVGLLDAAIDKGTGASAWLTLLNYASVLVKRNGFL